jgi:protein disulfide-isomerase A6
MIPLAVTRTSWWPSLRRGVDVSTIPFHPQKPIREPPSLFRFLANPGHKKLDCKSLAPIWEDLANDFDNEPSVIIAKVDAEAYDSKIVAKEQDITSYPVIKWFPSRETTPVEYEGGRTEAHFIEFVNHEAGTFRKAGGALTKDAGTLVKVDAAIQKIFDAGAELAGKIEDVVAALTKETGKSAEYYNKVVEKVKKTPGYVEKELARLEGIIKKGNLTPKKLDDLTIRSNILRKFNVFSTAKKGKDEL